MVSRNLLKLRRHDCLANSAVPSKRTLEQDAASVKLGSNLPFAAKCVNVGYGALMALKTSYSEQID